MTNMASARVTCRSLVLLLLLLAVTYAAVGGQSKQEGILPAAAPELTTLRTSTKVTKNSDDVTQIGIPESEADKISQSKTDDDEEEEEKREEEVKEEENEEEENEEEEEEEYEGDVNNDDGDDDDDDDEYEDELKAVAESHEAMSKDEARNSNISSVRNEQSREKSSSAQNFDSHEKSDESTFDESIMSNEAIISEVIKKAQDEEVIELLKYKMKESTKAKSKRVPTVKKELSTQKEILLANNETQVSKSLLPSEDPVNRLNDETDNVRRRALEKNELTDEKSREGVYLHRPPNEIGFNNTYGEEKNPSGGVKRLDKRQETVLKDLKAYLLAENAAEEERQRKLEELGVQEGALAESLLKLLVKLAEDPGKWQRVHKFLTDMENDLEVSNSQDSLKRNTASTTFAFSVTPPSNNAPKKNHKKLKKKKKKRPRHQQISTTMSTTTPIPETSLLTTTDTWSTTPQWRLVAERLFGPHWQENTHEEPENLAKMRIDPKPRILSSLWDLVNQNKSKNTVKTTNAEQKPLLLNASGKANTQSRLLGMRKINPLYLQDSREYIPVTDSDRLLDYDSSEAIFPRLRYSSTSDFPQSRNENDYRDDLTLQTNYFAHNQEYKPSSREFAISRSWPDLTIPPYKHSRPWSLDERPLFPISSDKWPWSQQSDFRYWPTRDKYRNHWTTLGIGKNDDRMDPVGMKDWQQQESPFWEAGKSHVWTVEEMPSLWPQIDKTMKPYRNDELTIWEKNKNHSELNKKEDTNNKVVLPKITMKTWNSLTSDPATWPYKLPSAKPWPKDENGKSYNPNADLIKKLGLDKENNADWSKDKDEKSGKLVFEKQTSSIFPKDARNKELTRLNDFKYKPISNKSNYNDYKKLQSQESMKEMPKWMYQNVKQSKEWIKPQTTSDSLEHGEMDIWHTKSEVSAGNPWLGKNSQPAILSTTQLTDGGQAKSQNDYLSLPRFLPFDTAGERMKGQKWLDKNKEGLIKYWTYSTKNSSSPGAKTNNDDFWRENSPWLSKTKENFWTTGMKSAPTSWDSKVGDNVSWASKADNNAWMPKSNNADSWTADGEIWPGKPNNVDSWPPSSNDGLPSWIAKGKNMNSWAGKPNNADWSQKMKDDNYWASKFNNMASWKNNNDNWKTEQNSWQPKINDDWNIGYGKNTAGTWPSKWKQFAYHKVTAVPILKPGTTADVSSAKSKNAFIAVSAVSSANYNNGNDWRKNDVREATRDDNFRPEKMDQSNNQIRPESERPIYAWKKNGLQMNNVHAKRNTTDPLENQLEALRQDDLWPYKQNEIETDEELVFTTTSTPQSAITANNTMISQLSQNQTMSKAVNTPSQAYQQELLMK